MEVLDAVRTLLAVRNYENKPVPPEVVRRRAGVELDRFPILWPLHSRDKERMVWGFFLAPAVPSHARLLNGRHRPEVDGARGRAEGHAGEVLREEGQEPREQIGFQASFSPDC